jgi:hypothetical protein
MPARPAHPLGRPPVQQAAVREALCRRIFAGEWQPGERLPPRTALIGQLGTTSATLQSALDELIADGLVVTRGVHGTFVHERSPHRFRFGLLLPQHPDGEKVFNRYWQALLDAAALVADGSGPSMEVFFGRHYRAESPSFDRLCADLARQRLAGLVVVAPPSMFADTPVLSTPVPRAFISGSAPPAGDLDLGVDWGSFRTLAVRRLAERGCRRLAVVGSSGLFEHGAEADAWQAECAAAGVGFSRAWLVAGDLLYPESVTYHLELLGAQAERPDGMVVADDNLLPVVLAILGRIGFPPGPGLQLLAHANFPLGAGEPLGIERIGFDAQRQLLEAIAFFGRRHAGVQSGSQRQRVAAEIRPA